jgi:threonine/homoserine/homoserine lactone efflux protein
MTQLNDKTIFFITSIGSSIILESNRTIEIKRWLLVTHAHLLRIIKLIVIIYNSVPKRKIKRLELKHVFTL